MGKDNTKNLVGQPIFKQIIKMIPKDRFDELVVQQKSDKGYRTRTRQCIFQEFILCAACLFSTTYVGQPKNERGKF
jgi:hypothetical protein